MSSTRFVAALVASAVTAGTLALGGCSAATVSAPASAGASAAGAAAPATSSVAIPAAQDLWTGVQDQIKKSETVRITGSGALSGKPMSFEIAGNYDGSNQTATIATGDAKATILTVSGKNYIKGNLAFWKLRGQSLTSAQASKYVVAKAQSSSSFSAASLFKSIVGANFGLVDTVNMQVAETTLDGTPAFEMSERVASKYEPHVWTTADGKGTLLKISGNDGSGNAVVLNFSDWNDIATVKAPPSSQILN